MSVYDCTPCIGLPKIYDQIEEGSIIEYKSKGSKNWVLAQVIRKELDSVWDSKVCNVLIVSLKGRKYYELRDLHDFHWRHDELYDCNKYLLEGYGERTKEVRLVDSTNVKNFYEHIKTPDENEAVLNALLKYGIIDKKSIDANKINVTVHRKNDRSNGKRYIKVWNDDKLVTEFWTEEPHSVFVDGYEPKTWAIKMSRKKD